MVNEKGHCPQKRGRRRLASTHEHVHQNTFQRLNAYKFNW